MNDTNERYITYDEIFERIKEIESRLSGKRVYGIPRGGATCLALAYGYTDQDFIIVDSAEQAEIILDDLIDSGVTKIEYQALNPKAEFIALFNKQTELDLKGVWLMFPYEESGTQDAENSIRRFIQFFDDGNREGLRETPKRYVKFMKEFLSPPKFNYTTFDSEGYDQMILVDNIPFYSLCEHHIAPFFGQAAIAYIPNQKIVGLSKLPRTLELYSRKFQNQERITEQVAKRIQKELNPKGVAVVLKAKHLCVEMRGVKKHDTYTTTSKFIGAFKDDMSCRNEFLSLMKI